MQRFIFLLFAISIFSSCADKPLPEITIIKQEEPGWDTKVKCIIRYSDVEGVHDFPAKIKYRGGMSSQYFKHSFTIELSQKYPLAGLAADDDWVLNANYIDKTFMRHKISYDLFREMSPDNIASQSAYVTLNIDTAYNGLYVLMEKINAGMLGLDKTDSMAMLFKDPPIFHEGKDFQAEDSLNCYEQKFPKIKSSDKTAYLEEFKSLLFESDDRTFAKDIEKWIDIDNIIDWHIMLLFSNNEDGIMKNFYLYKKDSETPFRIALWDYDHSYGRDGDNELNMGEKPLNWQRSILLKRLVNIKETGYSARLKKRWFELRRKNILSVENFRKHIEANNRIIHEAVIRNFERWPVNGDWYFDANGYNQEVDLMVEFLEQHIPKLDAYMEHIAE